MIVSGGVNIYPQEAENLLIMHPKLADAAVFGIPNAEFGEEVKAVASRSTESSRARTPRPTHRVLPSTPRRLQMPPNGRLRPGVASRSERQALQAADS